MTRSAHITLHRALDEARFGSQRILDLRSSFPTPADAVRRADLWLRERQMAKAGEVLVITGRGLGSPGGVSVVRAAISRLFSALKRKGVVSTVGEHTPGSFVVQLAPVRALFETVRRSRAREPRLPPAGPKELQALAPATRTALRGLAVHSLHALGAPATDRFVRDEMMRQLATISNAIASGDMDRDGRLRTLIAAAADAFDDAG
jgi:hypothetical protein